MKLAPDKHASKGFVVGVCCGDELSLKSAYVSLSTDSARARFSVSITLDRISKTSVSSEVLHIPLGLILPISFSK